MAESQVELMNRAVGGDVDALGELLAQVGPAIGERLSPKIRPRFRSVLDVDDVLQITYVEAFIRIGSFEDRGPGAFAAWLGRIADNNLRDAIRELQRKKRPPVDRRVIVGAFDSDSGAGALLDRLGWTSTTPSRCVSNQEQQAIALAAIDRLPPDYASVLRMYELEGRGVDEIAQTMGRSAGAVFMLRARAIDRLREILGGFSENSGTSP